MGERTLVLVKPDAVRRGLVGEVISRFERKGLAIGLALMFAVVVPADDSGGRDHHGGSDEH